jgi:hypothetical protein
MVVWCLLVALSPVCASAGQDQEQFSGTWTGSFDIHFADGKVIHDTAWLVLQQSGATVTGSVGPKPEQQGAIREGVASGDELRFVADSTPGNVLRFAMKREGDLLRGKVARTGNAAAPAPNPLFQKMLALDAALFDSFNKCSDPAEFSNHAAFFAPDVEFFHDLGGQTLGADALMVNTRNNVCGKFRRELDIKTFRVFPIPGYGAMTFGTHRFCHTPTTCEGVGEFATVWREKEGVWQVTRALSYAHASL